MIWTANWGVFEATELLTEHMYPSAPETGKKYQACQKINLMSSMC